MHSINEQVKSVSGRAFGGSSLSSVSSQITVSLSIRLSLNSFPHKRNIFHGSFHPVTDAILTQDNGKVIQKTVFARLYGNILSVILLKEYGRECGFYDG